MDRRVPTGAATTGRVLWAALAVATALLATACTTEDGTTATCVEDLSVKPFENQHKKGGCNPFAACLDQDGHVQTAEGCCKDVPESTKPLCLYAYGEGSFPTGTGSGGGAGSGGAGGGN